MFTYACPKVGTLYLYNYYNYCVYAGGRRCADDCTSLPPWDHPSCKGCNKYVTCVDGKLYERVCPPKLEWDNRKRMCNWPSHSTCYDLVSLVAFHRDPQSLVQVQLAVSRIGSTREEPKQFFHANVFTEFMDETIKS